MNLLGVKDVLEDIKVVEDEDVLEVVEDAALKVEDTDKYFSFTLL
jgi:hypothetical protein